MLKKETIIFIIIATLASLPVIYVVHTDIIKETSWTSHTLSGNIKEFTLYNSFPDNSLYIAFTNGKHIVVTENRFWAYTQLINLNTSSPVNITYKQNENNKILVTSINAFYYDST